MVIFIKELDVKFAVTS